MALKINDLVPDFTAKTDQGTITFYDWLGDSWAMLFSHPKNFTPVCTTELSVVAQLADEWAKRDTKVLGVSTDTVEVHREWKKDIQCYGEASAEFPIIGDRDCIVATLFGMLPAEAFLPNGLAPVNRAMVRSVFIISPEKKLRLALTYPMEVGRNFTEVLRALDAIQIAEKGVVTPVDWTPGEDVIIPPTVSDEDASDKFGEFETVLPYLRRTKAPE